MWFLTRCAINPPGRATPAAAQSPDLRELPTTTSIEPRSVRKRAYTRAAWRYAALYVAVLAAAIFVFFKVQIASSFSTLLGERFDGFIELSILEHWYNVVRGLEQWSTTGYFYPHKDGLGYNDGFFLFGLVFAGFRALGVDPFLSSELVNVAMRIVAFASMEALLRRRVAGGGWALFGAALFTIACNTSMRANHPQLLTVGLVPLFALLVWEAARAFARADRTAAVLLGCSAALLVGAWLLTAYYMAWFTVFYAAVYGAGA